ncbi:MAG: DNA mismatch repair protein MutS [Paludibacteraceae bacterium]|nr:DNA mismatch repair protein MutS [Paludibacteraceae bacterium]
MNVKKETPMMEQFRKIKEQYPDAMLLFRCGDFYETYAEDAVKAAKVLNITLTHRNNGAGGTAATEMAGFPFHALDTYLPKLVRAGMRVAICDQLEDPKLTKKLVKRGVTELVTPGLSYSDTTLASTENNFVACIHFPAARKSTDNQLGIAFLDISTGEFLAAEGNPEHLQKLLSSFAPKEVLFLRDRKKDFEELFGTGFFTFCLEDWMLTADAANDRLTRQFQTRDLKGFGMEHLPNAVIAAGGILHYLDITQHLQTAHINHLSRIEEDRYVWLDRFTVRNLELFGGQRDNGQTLLSVLDHTLTPMGARMLRRWVALPLKEVRPIKNRQQVVSFFVQHPDKRDEIRKELSHIQDLERIVSKISTGRIGPREMVQLGTALNALAPIRSMFADEGSPAFMQTLANQITLHEDMAQRINATIVPNPPLAQGKPNTIASGVDEELDRLRSLQNDSKTYLLNLQQRECAATGIQSLKIGFNNVFGYYLEVRNTYRDLVPPDWIRKQTLVSAERYITPELKDYEQQILTADEQIQIIENRLYNNLMLALAEHVPSLQQNAAVLAQIDCLLSFAVAATEYCYNCPDINDSLVLDIKKGRHPVIERHLPTGEQYVPNDIMLDNNSQQIIMLTGPNMAGKSALLRQTALIVLMAQMGSFVPAAAASVGIIDKVFTRVGASDNLAQGESTFMVEMSEAASIINNLSERSLVLFDELGRGTSTYDGISIAWAIVEHLHENLCHPKTLFATHYHELNEMESSFKRIRNYNVSVREVDGKVIFLRKLARGGSEHSFGIHVAKLAGMPPSIVKRADNILKDLEGDRKKGSVLSDVSATASRRDGLQLSIFQLDDPVLEQVRDEVRALDINSLTPLEALNRLSDIKRLVGG